jgi:hypothetical protein
MKSMNCKVKQFESKNGTVKNQFCIRTSEGVFFQSYNSMIAFKPFGGGKILLDRDTWDYSVTTGKYRNQFLNETKKETEAKIKAGVYELVNLNE